MITRSIENQIFTITSNRIGIETNGDVSLHFKGQSQVTSPDAERLAQASIDKEEAQTVEIDISKARDKFLSERNHIFKDRKPEMYHLLIEKKEF